MTSGAWRACPDQQDLPRANPDKVGGPAPASLTGKNTESPGAGTPVGTSLRCFAARSAVHREQQLPPAQLQGKRRFATQSTPETMLATATSAKCLPSACANSLRRKQLSFDPGSEVSEKPIAGSNLLLVSVKMTSSLPPLALPGRFCRRRRCDDLGQPPLCPERITGRNSHRKPPCRSCDRPGRLGVVADGLRFGARVAAFGPAGRYQGLAEVWSGLTRKVALFCERLRNHQELGPATLHPTVLALWACFTDLRTLADPADGWRTNKRQRRQAATSCRKPSQRPKRKPSTADATEVDPS